jgi:hypothetical protein
LLIKISDISVAHDDAIAFCACLNQAKKFAWLEGDGWVAANCNGVRVVFVHVPNSLAADKSKAVAFYKSIKNKVLNNIAGGGGVIDLTMGDTNGLSLHLATFLHGWPGGGLYGPYGSDGEGR